jgi:hypothetical protein
MGGVFTPSKEVSDAQFFSFEKLPLLPKSQLLLINRVLEMIKKPVASPLVSATPLKKQSFFSKLFKK